MIISLTVELNSLEKTMGSSELVNVHEIFMRLIQFPVTGGLHVTQL